MQRMVTAVCAHQAQEDPEALEVNQLMARGGLPCPGGCQHHLRESVPVFDNGIHHSTDLNWQRTTSRVSSTVLPT
jgi:hypothetical protein